MVFIQKPYPKVNSCLIEKRIKLDYLLNYTKYRSEYNGELPNGKGLYWY